MLGSIFGASIASVTSYIAKNVVSIFGPKMTKIIPVYSEIDFWE